MKEMTTHTTTLDIDECRSDFLSETFERTLRNKILICHYLWRKSAIVKAEEAKARGEKYRFIPGVDYFSTIIKMNRKVINEEGR